MRVDPDEFDTAGFYQPEHCQHVLSSRIAPQIEVVSRFGGLGAKCGQHWPHRRSRRGRRAATPSLSIV
jgi:hypothetical protein